MEFTPVAISDLIAAGAELSAHCRNCGHFKVLAPAGLPDRLYSRAVPALEGVFRCSHCQGRERHRHVAVRAAKKAR
jgi:hypothetical protein